MAKHPALDDVWKDDDRRLGLDRRKSEDRRSGNDQRSSSGFHPDPDRRVGAETGEATCPWGNPDRRQSHSRRKAVNE